MGELLKQSVRWAVTISLITAVLSMMLTVTSTSFLRGVPWSGGMVVVLLIILLGVFFDMLGIAATAAREEPFHAMAAKKVAGARHAIAIIRRADQFANFCNDVVGDISGIVSGAAGFAVATALMVSMQRTQDQWLFEMVIMGLISALTVGGKALGKAASIRYANSIVFQMGRLFYIIEEKFHIRLFDVKNKKKKRKRGVLRAPRTD
ncbi:hypothetical protein GCM10011571_09660 [Marinithermofilum abyssi]|uniref:Uncharacterized protein n=1 Tax=Marinithermofilum abyssi TaxID=1571185 RepID=A0A8J2Y8W3_9BACL|nr:hypothetical protein [Marinithermofilum abyssi]GGE10419.1 hypothetical protein GCM10011571_09660 [Marinithermofilum abyssi]